MRSTTRRTGSSWAKTQLPVEAAHLSPKVLGYDQSWSPGWMKTSEGNGRFVFSSKSIIESRWWTWRLQEAELVLPEVDHLSVLVASRGRGTSSRSG